MASPTYWPSVPQEITGPTKMASFIAADDIRYPVDTLTNPTSQVVITPSAVGAGALSGGVTITAGAVTAVAALSAGGSAYNSNAIGVVGNDGANTASLTFTVTTGVLDSISGYPTPGVGYLPGAILPVAGGTGGWVLVTSVDISGGIIGASLCDAAGVVVPLGGGIGTLYTAGNLVVGNAGVRALISFSVSNTGVLSAPVIVSAGSGLPAGAPMTIFAGPRMGQRMLLTDANQQNWSTNPPLINPGYQLFETIRATPFWPVLSQPLTMEFVGGAIGWSRV